MLVSSPPPPRLCHGTLARLSALCVVVLVASCLARTVGPPSPVGVREAAAVDGATSKAWILLDADSGQVLQAGNDRAPLRVASTAKILTALVVRRLVPIDHDVPISARAEGMPALKISVKAGQRWKVNDLLHSMLLASANDAAFALAEQAGGGSIDGFEAELAEQARLLGLADHPTLRDPAGLDDEFSVSGGNLISARDLAIATRALLNDPLLAAIVAMPSFSFTGGDGIDHRVVGHNGFMRTYPGAIGVKTGYTERSGSSLVAAARRDGRTFIAVVIDSTNADAQAAALLDTAFAGGVATSPTADVLPSVAPRAVYAGPGSGPGAAFGRVEGEVPSGSASSGLGLAVAIVVVLLGGLVVARRRQVALIEEQRRAQRRVGAPRRPTGSR